MKVLAFMLAMFASCSIADLERRVANDEARLEAVERRLRSIQVAR